MEPRKAAWINPMQLEKHHETPITENPNIFPFAGLVFGLLVWIIDAFVDVMHLDSEQELLDNIFFPHELTELWMRVLILIVFISAGFYSRYVLIKHIKLDQTLLEYQKKLEGIVAERTRGLIEKTEELEVLANTDPLTGLNNRRKFTQILNQELERYHRYKQSFSILSIDIDRFKKINDTYGHDTGDKVLKQFSGILKSSVRRSDCSGRWGGEEFVLLIVESSREQAQRVAENLLSTLNKTNFTIVGKVSASIGITLAINDDTHESIINRSDNALYKAKENGRNRIEFF